MTRKPKYLISAIVLISVSLSCSRVPKGVLSEKDMRSVLFDMQVAEGMVETNHDDYKTSIDRQVLYDAVFAKHNISQADYDSSMIWYGKNMDLYMQIYKLVLKDVNAAITALGDIRPNPLSGEALKLDSIDVWINDRAFILSQTESLFDALNFDIKPEQPYPEGSSYVFGVDVWGIPENTTLLPSLRIYAEQKDTVISVSGKISGNGFYEFALLTDTTKTVDRVYGHVFMLKDEKTKDKDYPLYLNNLQMIKYNKDSKATTAPSR